MITIEELKNLKESEDKVEFKRGERGNISYDGGTKIKPSDRRRCILGYVTAMCNEEGGYLVIGMSDNFPHEVVGTAQNFNSIGQLEANIYRDINIRPKIYELYEDYKRVLVIEIPSRPPGKVFKFEDVALMRVGEELKPMSDEKYIQIVQEQEPDYSELICDGLTIYDLDQKAIEILKDRYATKQNNQQFRTLSNQQILIDLELIRQNKLTNAALILLGKEEVISSKLPQAKVMLEYRNLENQITFDNRIEFIKPFFILIDELWETINLRNGSFPIQEGAYIFNVPFFNEEVIREAVNNAITHRDYRITSEIVLKQFPHRLDIVNAGGFPIGVTIKNLLNTPSTPRNRLLADVLQKTGIVERSGQGVDKIFYNTLSEGKSEPDYSSSDDFQVTLKLSAMIKDRAFALFIDSVQSDLPQNQKLSVYEILILNEIKKGNSKSDSDLEVIQKLLNKNLIEKRGKTKSIFYILSKDYYEFTDEKANYYSLLEPSDNEFFVTIINFLTKEESAKLKDFVNLYHGKLSRRQVGTRIGKLVSEKTLEKIGERKLARYILGENYIKEMEVISEAIDLVRKNKKA